jgi:putative membrane protein
MSSEPALVPGGGERRLHPLSWLFVLLQQLKSFALPLLVLIFTGRGNSWELWGLVGVGVLAALSVAQYFTYRFRIDDDGVVVRSGLLQRSLRHIPYQRVQNVALHQTLLHRLFGVAEVRLESAAGGMRPEAEMRVLSLADAHSLEALVRDHGRRERAGAAVASGEAVAPRANVLLALSTAEVVRLGLISNRGMVLVVAAVGVVAQNDSKLIARAVEYAGRSLFGFGERLHLDWIGWAAGALALGLLALALLRALSIVLAVLQYHGFELRESGRRLSVERGLLTRSRANMPRDRIQAWTLAEGVVQRLLRRRSLAVDSATVEQSGKPGSARDIAPVITVDGADALVRHLLPGVAWPPAQWRSLHPKAWRRQFTLPALAVLVATAVLAWREGPLAFALLALLPAALLRARIWARHAGWSEDGRLIAVREGWLVRHWRFAEVRKVQALKLSQSPFDRRHGMATLLLDTAGASPFDPPLRIRYLPEAEARALHDRLAARLAAPVTPARTAGSAAPAA